MYLQAQIILHMHITENIHGRLTPTDGHGYIDVGVHAATKNLD